MKMMFQLLKINLINNLSLNKVFNNKKKSKKHKSSNLLGSILLYGFIALLIIFYSLVFSMMFASGGRSDVIITYGAGLGGLLCLIMTLGQSYGILFQSKDFDLLATMPIKKSYIVSSKLLGLVLVNSFYFNIAFIPSAIVFMIFEGFSIYAILALLSGILLGPMLAVSVCSFLSFLLGRLLSGFKYKNLLSAIFSVAFIILVFVFSFSIGSMEEGTNEQEYINSMADMINKSFGNTYFVSVFLNKAFLGEILYLLCFILASVVPFSIFVLFIAKNFVRINSNQNIGYKEKNFKLKKQNDSSLFIGLLKKEAKLFFSTNVYFMNVIVSPILSTACLLVLYFSLKDVEGFDFSNYSNYIPLIACVLLSFIKGMTTSSSSSISMEGRQFWIIKTSPIDPKSVLRVKSMLNVFINLPFILIDFVLLVVLYKVNILYAFISCLSVFFIVCTVSFMGTWLNLCKYLLDWDNPSIVVKSSSTTLFAMLVGFAIDFIFAISALVSFAINLFIPLICLFISIVLAILSYVLVMTDGRRRYNNIEV